MACIIVITQANNNYYTKLTWKGTKGFNAWTVHRSLQFSRLAPTHSTGHRFCNNGWNNIFTFGNCDRCDNHNKALLKYVRTENAPWKSSNFRFQHRMQLRLVSKCSSTSHSGSLCIIPYMVSECSASDSSSFSAYPVQIRCAVFLATHVMHNPIHFYGWIVPPSSLSTSACILSMNVL